jgi:hypothetical protein
MNDHMKMLHAVTEYDRKQAPKPGYSIYALPQYLAAVQRITDDIADGHPTRQAILARLSGRLATAVLKSVGLPAITRHEARGAW